MHRISILNQGYPPPENSLKNGVISLLFGLFIASFLIFFEPFDINIRNYTTGELAFFGLITTLCFLFFQNLLPSLFPKFFHAKTWKVKHQIGYYLLLLFCISSLNGLYINYLRDLPFSWRNYGQIIVQTFGLGIIAIGLLVLLDFNWRLRKNLQQAAQLNQGLTRETQKLSGKSFTIQTDLKETFSLREKDFLFAQSSGNYLYIHRSHAPKALHRLSLNALERQLNSDSLQRCHRSFLVNLRQVTHMEGNAQGLKLFFEESEEAVPVSRKYLDAIKAYIEPSRI